MLHHLPTAPQAKSAKSLTGEGEIQRHRIKIGFQLQGYIVVELDHDMADGRRPQDVAYEIAMAQAKANPASIDDLEITDSWTDSVDRYTRDGRQPDWGQYQD